MSAFASRSGGKKLAGLSLSCSDIASSAAAAAQTCSAMLDLSSKAESMSATAAKASDISVRCAAAREMLSAADGWLDLSAITLANMPDSLTAWYDEAYRVASAAVAEIESSDAGKYRKELYKRYCAENSDMPWYNLANSWHPSFLVHPNLKAFQQRRDGLAIPDSGVFSLSSKLASLLD